MSPDLKPIENLWEIARKVYGREKSPTENAVELKKEIEPAWTNIENETLNKIVDSVPNRFIEVIKNKGKSTKHRMRR